jgi:hypothetical protein
MDDAISGADLLTALPMQAIEQGFPAIDMIGFFLCIS